MAQQTAVEWLIEELEIEMGYGRDLTKSDRRILDEIIAQAKSMEKEQIVVSFYEGMKTNTFDPNMGRGVMYYNETYNK